MDFKNIPFQFSSTDPVKRQAELRKRFGLQSLKDSMLVDFPNSSDKFSSEPEIPVSSSPRLQHRVPIFYGDSAEPAKPSVDAQGSPGMSRKPRVRNIPIQIERADSYDKWHHAKPSVSPGGVPYHFNGLPHHVQGPRVHNIPVKVEKRKDCKVDSKACKQRSDKTEPCDVKKPKTEKDVVKVSQEPVPNIEEQQPDPKVLIQNSLQKIENVKSRMEGYRKTVESFSGTLKDKNYRYLDEMLTRCMLELDEIETHGHEEVRLNRKCMVKEVQACIDLLDSKVRNAEQKSADQELDNADLQSSKVDASDSEIITDSVEEAPSSDTKSMKESPAMQTVEEGSKNDPSVSGSGIVPDSVESAASSETENMEKESPELQTIEECDKTSDPILSEINNRENDVKESISTDVEMESVPDSNVTNAKEGLVNEPLIEEPCENPVKESHLTLKEMDMDPCEVDEDMSDELGNSPLVEEPSDNSNLTDELDSSLSTVETCAELSSELPVENCILANEVTT